MGSFCYSQMFSHNKNGSFGYSRTVFAVSWHERLVGISLCLFWYLSLFPFANNVILCVHESLTLEVPLFNQTQRLHIDFESLCSWVITKIKRSVQGVLQFSPEWEPLPLRAPPLLRFKVNKIPIINQSFNDWTMFKTDSIDNVASSKQSSK